jgi:hypothetical protein
MRERFSGWYPRSADQVAAIWSAAIFVPDANVLLHCLRHPANVREELLRLFDVLKDSLWIPYQVGLEFHRNRLDVEFGAQDAYDRLGKEYETTLTQVRERLRQLRAHPVISVEREIAALDIFLEDFRSRMITASADHPAAAIAAAVDRVTDLFHGKIGEKWKAEQLNTLKKEGEERYAKKIPPGYKDSKKDASELDKFGDLIIWKDMIGKAKSDNRPIVFISDDSKEDWWWIHRGRKLGARPELIEEFRTNANQDFHIYEFTQFLRIAGERHPEIQAGVEEIEKSVRGDEQARKRLSGANEIRELMTRVAHLEDERDLIISSLSGTPTLDTTKPSSTDRLALRARLSELNLELEEAQSALRDDKVGDTPPA